jgi:tRNA threonylcarbamoyladenosine dehydratase
VNKDDFLSRTEIMIGKEALSKISSQSVYIAGLGGVGAYAAEALVRSGVGKITLHDADIISFSNLNRQLIALRSTLGKKKTEVMKSRLLDINPICEVRTKDLFITNEVMPDLFEEEYDVIVDAIDVFNCKLAFLRYAFQKPARLYSSMGAGNRIDPTAIKSGDLFASKNCRLAKVLRKKLRHSGITEGITAVWSEEIGHASDSYEEGKDRPINGSISTIPGIFGLTLAGLILKDVIESNP